MSLRIALVMMQKNEGHLLEAWITYHRNLVDPASLFIFDNGSNDAHTLTILRAAEKTGIAINKDFCQDKDYFERGIIFCNLIKQLDRDDPHDFYFPIDCDEFLATKKISRPLSRTLLKARKFSPYPTSTSTIPTLQTFTQRLPIARSASSPEMLANRWLTDSTQANPAWGPSSRKAASPTSSSITNPI
jgi:hypothetical protein